MGKDSNDSDLTIVTQSFGICGMEDSRYRKEDLDHCRKMEASLWHVFALDAVLVLDP